MQLQTKGTVKRQHSERTELADNERQAPVPPEGHGGPVPQNAPSRGTAGTRSPSQGLSDDLHHEEKNWILQLVYLFRSVSILVFVSFLGF